MNESNLNKAPSLVMILKTFKYSIALFDFNYYSNNQDLDCNLDIMVNAQRR